MDTALAIRTYTKQNERHIASAHQNKIWRISVSGQSKNAFLCLLTHIQCLNNCKDTFFLQYDALMKVLFLLKISSKETKSVYYKQSLIIINKINSTSTIPHRSSLNNKKVWSYQFICQEVLVNLSTNKQYPTPIKYMQQKLHIAIQVMSVIASLCFLKFTRFPDKDKS